jgi:hypothetical protein
MARRVRADVQVRAALIARGRDRSRGTGRRNERSGASSTAGGSEAAVRPDMTRLSLLLGFALTGCYGTTDGERTVSSSLVVEDPDAYVGAPMRIEGTPRWMGICNAGAAPTDDQPWNNCWGGFVYGDTSGPSQDLVHVVPSESWPYERAVGFLPQMCYDDVDCLEGHLIGCHGNDYEAECAPAIPTRILSFDGVLTRDARGRLTFTADDVEIAADDFDDSTGHARLRD